MFTKCLYSYSDSAWSTWFEIIANVQRINKPWLIFCFQSKVHKFVLSYWNNSTFRKNLLYFFLMRYFRPMPYAIVRLIRIKSVLFNKQSKRINEWNLWMSFGLKYAHRKRTLVTVSSQMIQRITDWTLWMILGC